MGSYIRPPGYAISEYGKAKNIVTGSEVNVDHSSESVSVDGESFTIKALMGCAFLGNDIRDPYRNRVLFKDGNSSNMRLDNLYIEDTSDLPGEIWATLTEANGKKVKDFYCVSNKGRVKSVKHDTYSLTEASLAIGRSEGYISEALKRGGVIRNKAGQEMHLRLVGDAPVVGANEIYKEKKAKGLIKPAKEQISSQWAPRKPVKCIETGEIYPSLAAADKAIGQPTGYISNRFAYQRQCVDAAGNICTFEFIDENIKIHYRKNPCYIDEIPGKEFGNLSEASIAIGRSESYINDRIKLKKPILSKDGQLIHFHYIEGEKGSKLVSEYYSQLA